MDIDHASDIAGFNELNFVRTNTNLTIDYWTVDPYTLAFVLVYSKELPFKSF